MDYFGLDPWKIHKRGFSASAVIISFSYNEIEFASECINNQRTIKKYKSVGMGLTVGLEATVYGNWGGEKDSSKGYFGATNVYKDEPNPISGVEVSGPSAGFIKGGTLGSATIDFSSFADVHAATTEKRLGASLFSFEGQKYKLIGVKTESCCE